jgi:signal transduction histidine kinase/ActR/RegA family two-component response regulator
MLGHSREELLTMSLADGVAPEESHRLAEDISKFPGNDCVKSEWRLRRRNGTILVGEVNARRLPDTRLLGVVRDITERIEAEANRRSLESQLAQAQKMEAIGRLAGGIAHDFNNLLTVINGNCEVLLAGTSSANGKAKTMLTCIRDAGEHAAALTRQLLTFSRQQVIEPRVFEINSAVRNIETLLRRLIGDDIRLVTKLETQPSQVEADPAQIGQILVNLAVNARDAMANGGTLTITTRNAEIDESAAREHGMRAGSYVLLAADDTGCGMTPEVRARIFEPFFTTKDPGKGTGIGLATVRTIVDESKGFIVVESEPGSGSTFNVYLPVVKNAVIRRKPECPQAELSGGEETILLVEDDREVRAITQYFLREAGYEVAEAGSGLEALSISEQHAGPIDLLVTDLVLPELNGKALAERLTFLRPNLKVLYLSGYMDLPLRPGVLQGDDNFLQKPFAPSALVAKVREVLDRSASLVADCASPRRSW